MPHDPRRPKGFPVRPDASRRGGDYGENKDISPSDTSDYLTDFSEQGLAEHRRRQAIINEVQREVRDDHEKRESQVSPERRAFQEQSRLDSLDHYEESVRRGRTIER
jgi:hypothetical protein